MPAMEVVAKVRIPEEIKGWEDISIEERYQRGLNEGRVKNHIAPYLAEDENRFFGSLLVAVQTSTDIEFEPLGDIASKIPRAYKASTKGAGFLTLQGDEIMMPIDGQHRLRALKYAIDGKDTSGKDLNFHTVGNLAEEDVTVILFKFDAKVSRMIFSKVNRYAKPTTKAENLITDDDDVVAVITRRIANDVIGAGLVNSSSNTLSDKAPEFTTLATLYDCLECILEGQEGKKISKNRRSNEQDEKHYYRVVKEILEILFQKINHFEVMLMDSEKGDLRRRELRQKILLAKPIAQLCLVRAFMQIRKRITIEGRTPQDKEILAGLNAIDWRMDNPAWQRILMEGMKIKVGKGTVKLATDFTVYFAGFMPDQEERNELLERYKNSYIEEEQQRITELPKL